MAFGNFTLTGHFDNLSGTAPAIGSVRIDGNPQVVADSAGNAVRVGPRTVTLNGLGNFSITLPSDSSAGDSVALAFKVTPVLKGLSTVYPTNFYARQIGSTVDLADIISTRIPEGIGAAEAAATRAEAAASAAAASAASVSGAGVYGGAGATVVASNFADNSADATAYLNGLIANVSAMSQGGTVQLFHSGIYRIDGSLLLRSNVTIDLNGAWLRKNYNDNAGSPSLSMLRNVDLTTKVNNVRVVGPGRIGSDPAYKTGNIIFVYGDDLTLDSFHIDGWSAGRAIGLIGDRARLDSVWCINCTGLPGDGGIRVMGGDDGTAIACHVESGDDALQLVPAGSGSVTAPQFFSKSIRRFSYIGCTGSSSQGRFMIAALQNPDTSGGVMTASVLDCSFLSCHGTGGTHFALYVQNQNSTGDIDGLRFTDSTTDASVQTATAEAFIERSPSTLATVGHVRNITLDGYRMRSPHKTPLITRGYIEHLTLQGCDFYAPSLTVVANAGITSGSATMTVPATPLGEDGTPLPSQISLADVGATVTGTGIQSGTVVSGVALNASTQAATVTLSKTATVSADPTSVNVGGTWTLDLTSTYYARLIGCRVQGGGNSHTVQGGANDVANANGSTTPNTTAMFTMRDTLVYDIPDGFYGLNLNRAALVMVNNCTFIEKAGSSTAGAIRVAAASSKVRLIDNDVTAISTPAKMINDLAADTMRSRNLGADTATAIPPTDVQVFTANGTWTKPAGALRVEALVISGGGGGGAGRRGAAATIRCGGGGGGGGIRFLASIAASELNPTEPVIVGVGGTGGVAASADTTDGGSGVAGGQSLFAGTTTTRFLIVQGGIGGAGGTVNSGVGGSALGPGCAAGGSASTTGLVGVATYPLQRASVGSAAGGGSGGGITAANADSAGGQGWTGYSGTITAAIAGGTAGGGAGGPAIAARTNAYLPGAAGSGGGSSAAGAGGNGGAGGLRGGGGGGGGASVNGFASGAGGAGADGVVVVTTFFS